MNDALYGFRFRITWAATGYTIIVNGRTLDAAQAKADRFAFLKKALHVRYLGVTEPLPKDLPRIPYKVF